MDRLLAFLRAAAGSDRCAAVRFFLEHVDAGVSVEDVLLTRDDDGGGFEFSVTPIAGNRFEVEFGYSAMMVGDGGSWTVDFDEAGNVTALEPGISWIT
ncbi:MAG: hypothetical protein R2745_20270 [Vicinamibacterales bacterium]